MIDTRRSTFARRSLAHAERSPLIRSKDPAEWSNLRTGAVVRQVRETLDRAVRSEQTTDAGKPK